MWINDEFCGFNFCFDGDQLVGTLKSKAATNVIYFLERPNEDNFRWTTLISSSKILLLSYLESAVIIMFY